MQILDLVLYSLDGQRRDISFRTGAVNIITGSSGTGKTALSDIIEYCLGRSTCAVADGVVLRRVLWYGLRLQVGSSQMFIARASTLADAAIAGKVYFDCADEVSAPESVPTPNLTVKGLVDILSQRLGIASNRQMPEPDRLYPPLEANIKHSLFFCLQQQDEIASRRVLFHRQAEDGISEAIKQTLPYFLGAIREDQLRLEQDLERAKRQLQRAERALKEAEAIKGEGIDKASSLFAEARQVGFYPDRPIPVDLADFITRFREIRNWQPMGDLGEGEDRLFELQGEARKIDALIKDKQETLATAKTYAHEAEGFQSEARYQEDRLEAIGLYDAASIDGNVCPLCLGVMANPLPGAKAIERSLSELRTSISDTDRVVPHLRSYIEGLETELDGIRQRRREIVSKIEAITQEQATATKLHDINLRRARVAGRISLWMESADTSDETAAQKLAVARARREVEELEDTVDVAGCKLRLDGMLDRIGGYMTQWADDLSLEHSGNPVRLDLTRLTVTVSTPQGKLELSRIGSGKNWVFYHLLAYLALHKHFRENTRPIPQFLFLDQPSQFHYPLERDEELQGSIVELDDRDREAVKRMYGLIFDVTKELAPHLQIIITDHADISDAKFQEAVILPKWRSGNALVPRDWPEIPSKER